MLGNHDYYGSSIKSVRSNIDALCQIESTLCYLSNHRDIIELSKSTALIGHDGWADLRYGDFKYSSVWMRDYSEIDDLKGLKKKGLRPVMEQMGYAAAQHIKEMMGMALLRYDKLIVLTHVPPFMEACWHEGQISDKEWLPHFTCKAVGDEIRQISLKHNQKKIVVFCGHTHSSGKARILPNLRVLTQGAEYGEVRQPIIATLS